MSSIESSSQLVYWLIAGPIGLVGLWLIVHGLFWDRPKGRPRCPKCCYDLSGIPDFASKTLPVTCPECGREVRFRWQFYMSWPHKRMVALGLSLLILCLYGSQVRYRMVHLNESFNTAVVPTTYWIATAPGADEANLERIILRASASMPWRNVSSYHTDENGRDNLWFWQRALLSRSCRLIINGQSGPFAETALYLQLRLAEHSDTALESVIDTLNHSNAALAWMAANDMTSFGERAWRAGPRLVELLMTANPPRFHFHLELLNSLNRLGSRHFEGMKDKDLCAIIDECLSTTPVIASTLNAYLVEAVRRNTPYCREHLQTLAHVGTEGNVQESSKNAINLEVLTAAHRIQGKNDPLTLKVHANTGKERGKPSRLPTVAVIIAYAQTPEKLVILSRTRAYTNRSIWFHFAVRDQSGNLMPIKQRTRHFGMDSEEFILLPGEQFRGVLDMNEYMKPLAPGRYSMVVQYNSTLDISNMNDGSQMILLESEPLELIIE